jgi:cell division septation protein DedD
MDVYRKPLSSVNMAMNKAVVGLCCVLLLGIWGCSRQQSDWEKTRAANTTDSYEQFLKKYPTGEFTAQAEARVKELYEERDWQKARDTDTQEAYQGFLKQYPEGKWTEEARIRVENFTLAQTPANATPGGTDTAGTAGETGTPAATAPAPAAKPPVAAATPPAATAAAPSSAPSAKAAKPPATGGSYGVQLGAFKSSADAANKRWAHLNKEYPKLLAGLSPTVAPKKGASGTLYRLQVAGLTEKHARAICKSLKAKSQACVLIPTAHHGKVAA